MRKLFLFVAAVAIVSCGNNGRAVKNEEPQIDTASVEVTETVEKDTIALRNNAVQELKNWGAFNAYIDDNGYLVYEAHPADINGNADDVELEYYKMFISATIKGVRIINFDNKELLGSYPK